MCRRAGLDLATDRIPVGPAAHYLMGGVVTDVEGRTTIPGLFAAGEVACTGVHGANRLASNSLLEGLLFGARAGLAMRTRPDALIDGAALRDFDGSESWSFRGNATGASSASVQSIMWEDAGLFRTEEGLWRAIERLGIPSDHESSEVTVGRLIALAAVRREESRGGHFPLHFPPRDDQRWKRRIMETVD